MYKSPTNRPVLALYHLLLCLVCTSFLFLGCNDDVTIPEGALEEHLVDIRGDWQLKVVNQNNDDISERMSFSDLTLRLEMNNEGPTDYQIETAGLPFVILEDGTWTFDDNAYPTAITFTSSNASATILLDRPPISGGEFLSMSFSLGCNENNYVYEFIKQ